MKVLPDSLYNIGDTIRVYYAYGIYSTLLCFPEDTPAEDMAHNVSEFYVDGVEQLHDTLEIHSPPKTLEFLKFSQGGYLDVIIGQSFTTRAISTISDTIQLSMLTSGKDGAYTEFFGNIIFYLEQDSRTEFSLDIGSDSEISDPNSGNNGLFDPGDAYVLGGSPLSPAGQNGVKDDYFIFNHVDPSPVPGDMSTAAPCGQGLPFKPADYFDLDGMDNIKTPLDSLASFGLGMPSIQVFDDRLIHIAQNFIISFDDDKAENYSYTNGAIPVNSFSPDMNNTFGKAVVMDEVVAYDLNPFVTPSTGYTTGCLYNERTVHESLVPNPDSDETSDDDVDALDYFWDQNQAGLYYFSPDHEATSVTIGAAGGILLNGGSIYLSRDPNNLKEVINGKNDLGLLSGTDIDAFEFGWVWDTTLMLPNSTPRGLCFALLFSVDNDDPLTPENESGGLSPAVIYYSFLNGYSYEYSDTLSDDIDAIALCDHSYNGWVNMSCNPPTNLKAENITQMSAELSWTPGGTETSWNIEYGPAGFVLGTGTFISGVGNPYPLTGIAPSTTYDFYVQADCGGGSFSNWAGPCNFTTLASNPCNTPTNLTVSNITDVSAQLNWTPGGTETSWNIEYGFPGFVPGSGILISGVGNPYLLTGLTPGTPYVFYVQADCGGGSVSGWAGPCAFTTLYSCDYSFTLYDTYGDGWNGATMDVIQFGVVVQTIGTGFISGQTFTEVVTIFDGVPFDVEWNVGGIWPAECGLEIIDPFGTQLYYASPIGAIAVGTILYSGIGNCPFNCLAPTALTVAISSATTADLTWIPGGSETSWNIEYGLAGFVLGTGILIQNVGNPYTITGLTPGTNYDFYVQANCSGGVASPWSAPCNGSTFFCQTLNIPQGWSGISTWLDPQPNDLGSMFAPAAGDLVIMMNMTDLWWPAMGINSLINWDVYSGYAIKVQNDVSLQVCGTLPATNILTVNPGWTLIPVLKSTSISTSALFGGLSGMVLAKEIGGSKIYWPYYNLYSLAELKPGKAYFLYASNGGTLSYAKSGGIENISPTSEISSPWNEVIHTGTSHLLAVNNTLGAIEKGEIIGAFNSSGECAGYSLFDGMSAVLTIFGDDVTTPEIDGMTEGEDLMLKVFNPKTNTDRLLVATFDASLPDSDGLFRVGGISAVSLKTGVEIIDDATMVSIYPNPAKDNIQINVPEGKLSIAEYVIFDFTGRIVMSGSLGGMIKTDVNISNLPKGVYQVALISNDNRIVKKLIIQ